ncbi:MAG: class I SAM-dependent methyltransferase [Proteobacteria bacterium]|nr:class I SAM-dependent methyltransferase [Pseudomonadota bacterium]
MTLRSRWDAKVLPGLIERACRSHAILDERRRWVPEARGAVLEVGVGSGLNLAFYDPARAQDVIGIDLSPPLLARAAARASAAPVPVTLQECDAERLAFDRGRFDTVLVTYTLCSVGDLAASLAEIHRVLRPDGQLVLVEHGRSPDARTQRWQRWITPVWRRVGGNCHLDRDVPRALEDARFATSS